MWYWQWECADAIVEVWDFPASAACPEPQQWRQRRWRFNDREVSLVGFLWWKITGSLSAPPLSLWMRVYTGSKASMWRSLRKREAARRLDTTWYLQLIFNYTFKSVCLSHFQLNEIFQSSSQTRRALHVQLTAGQYSLPKARLFVLEPADDLLQCNLQFTSVIVSHCFPQSLSEQTPSVFPSCPLGHFWEYF